ncbi:glycoside hydrolase family 113 [Mycobacterium sp. C3-094]
MLVSALSTVAILTAVMVDDAGLSSAQSGSQQRGFAFPTWRVDGYDAASLEPSLRETLSLGANWVQFTPTWYQQTRASSEMSRTAGTVSDSGLERAIGLAHQVGLKVLLKPHVDLPVPGQDSRNNILPDDRAAWFAAYTGFITHYAAMAQRLGVEQFAVGTELSSISFDRTAWLQVIDEVRARYDGVVLYAAGRDWETVPFWDALDMIGIDAYLPLSDAPTSDVTALEHSWSSVIGRLAALAAQYGRQILFTEAGYTSQRGTVTDPSNWRISTEPDQAEQASAYEALLTAFSGQPWWAGVFWWVWITPPDTVAEPLDFSPRGKTAESVVRQRWSS